MINLKESQIINPTIIIFVSDDIKQWKEAALYSIDYRLNYPFATHNNRYTYCRRSEGGIIYAPRSIKG